MNTKEQNIAHMLDDLFENYTESDDPDIMSDAWCEYRGAVKVLNHLGIDWSLNKGVHTVDLGTIGR